MAKYICDFAAVNAVGSKLIESASTLTSAVNDYSSSIDSDLSTWNGKAKSTFDSQKATQVEMLLSKAKYMSEFGEFIQKAAQSIQELDDKLSGLSI